MNKPKLWTKDFLIVSIANFFLYFTFYMLIATITVFATEKFQATPSAAGLASGIFVLGALVARFLLGDRLSKLDGKRCFILVLFHF